mgnify:CR=1 FL=1
MINYFDDLLGAILGISAILIFCCGIWYIKEKSEEMSEKNQKIVTYLFVLLWVLLFVWVITTRHTIIIN